MRDNESSSADPFAKIHTGGGSAAQLCEVASVRVVVRGEVDPAGRGKGKGKGKGKGNSFYHQLTVLFTNASIIR